MQTTLKVKTMVVKKAVKKAYQQMPERFSSLTLCLTTRSILQNMTMDGTILRRLRDRRESGECPYKVIDSVNSIYQKI